MGLTSRPDRVAAPAVSGIPGASRQPELPRRILNLSRSQQRGVFRSRRGAERVLSLQLLNGLLADSMVLYEHYRKDTGDKSPYGPHLILDDHVRQQRALIEVLVDRVHTLGGTATVPSQVAELTVMSRPPEGPEDPQDRLLRLLDVQELIIKRIREAITAITTSSDEGTRALLRDLLRHHEWQRRFVADQLVDGTALSA